MMTKWGERLSVSGRASVKDREPERQRDRETERQRARGSRSHLKGPPDDLEWKSHGKKLSL
jgi:hypothetical protein